MAKVWKEVGEVRKESTCPEPTRSPGLSPGPRQLFPRLPTSPPGDRLHLPSP